MKALRTLVIASIALALLGPRAGAQSYFGQNQVQYDKFDWKVFETEHFLVHYYEAERAAAMDAARMAERAYARLSRLMQHQFREKKPIVVFASRSDFAQNNVFGDLGEGTGGVTEALRHRILMPFTGDYQSFEHVLAHELVHAFQYDIFARGKAGAGLQTLAQVQPPLWYMEGMAEYLAGGPGHPITHTWMRDAALNGRLPTIEQMTLRPDRFFPYRYGEALWEYIGRRWGDEVIGQIMQAAPNVGIERAFKRELGLSLAELSDEWHDAAQVEFLTPIPQLDRPRRFAQPMLTQRRSGGEIFLAPALSSDGRHIAFLSTGSFARGEVFIDLWLGDARTGRRQKRLVKSTTDPDFEELRLLYSQSAFSPDGRHLAFTAQRAGKDVLYLLDVRRRETVRRYDLPLEGVTGPSFSPDGQRIVFSGNVGGITDLYVVNIDGTNLQRLTNDRHGDLQPQWSPDGNRIAFASERGDGTDFDQLKFAKWRISILDLTNGTTTVLPGQGGLNLNPNWSPDGKSLAYVTDRTGIQNLFLYDFDAREHYQLTNVIGGVLAITEYSPVISWARQADRLAFTYFEDGDFTVWSIDNPRLLKRSPFREGVAQPGLLAVGPGARAPSAAAIAAEAAQDTVGHASVSHYRSGTGFRPSAALPAEGERTSAAAPLTVSALLDSAALALPDTTAFKRYDYKVRFQPDYVAQPTIGYANDNFGRGVFGGTTIILSDLLGNNRLAFSGEINGRVSEARLYASYANLGHRIQYATGAYQQPYYFLSGDELVNVDENVDVQRQQITRYIIRQAFGVGIYPLNRFTRVEFGAQFNNIDRALLTIERTIYYGQGVTPFRLGPQENAPGLTYVAPYLAYVSDNVLFGSTGPIFGRRYRVQVEPTIGSFRWVEYLADYRRYDPIIFNYLTIATRAMANISVGRDERQFPKYIGRPEYIRGYDRENYFSLACNSQFADPQSCSAARLLGSRFALANAEVRFPLIRRFELGLLPIALPPLDGLVFYDVGLAWSAGQNVQLQRPNADDNDLNTRYPLSSWGLGLRLNLFNYVIVRWDYAIPLDRPGRKGFWTWSLGPSF